MKARLSHARTLLGLSLATLATGCGDDWSPRGALMLSITTDMAVPNDIDHLVWSVTLDGQVTPFDTGSVSLASGTDFPVTLAIHAGRKTRSPITIRVEGRKGAAPAPPKLTPAARVTREAKLSVPQDRIATLDLPLSWLCSPANFAAACEIGWTCQAGHCVDAAVETESLPEFQASPARSCYDVTACPEAPATSTVGPFQLESGEQVACGLSGTTLLGPDADVSVLLEVRNEQVGNYGFCKPNGQCFIPLQRGETPESWRAVENGATPAIELPSAVCENSNTSVRQVAFVRASALCPSAEGYRPLCSPKEAHGCLPVQEVCPSTSPKAAWAGYACTEASPTGPDIVECWKRAMPNAEGYSPNDGRFCCLKSQPSSDDALPADPLLIDDMRDGPQVKLRPAAGYTAGWWYTDYPYGSGDLVPAPSPSLYTYRHFDKPVGPPGGPKFSTAACLSSRGFRGWQAKQGFDFAIRPGGSGRASIDVRQYDGISFWGWADEPFFDAPPQPVQVTFPNEQVSTQTESDCVAPASACESYFKEVALTREWKQYFVRWEDLAQSERDWGQTFFTEFERQIYSVYFAVRGAGPNDMSQPFEFCIADIHFEQARESPQ